MAAPGAPVKTQLGLDELRGRARTLGQRHRTVLLLVDGRRPLSEVLGLALQAGAQTSHFEDLVRMGMVELPPDTAVPDARESAPSAFDSLRVTSVELEVPGPVVPGPGADDWQPDAPETGAGGLSSAAGEDEPRRTTAERHGSVDRTPIADHTPSRAGGLGPSHEAAPRAAASQENAASLQERQLPLGAVVKPAPAPPSPAGHVSSRRMPLEPAPATPPPAALRSVAPGSGTGDVPSRRMPLSGAEDVPSRRMPLEPVPVAPPPPAVLRPAAQSAGTGDVPSRRMPLSSTGEVPSRRMPLEPTPAPTPIQSRPAAAAPLRPVVRSVPPADHAVGHPQSGPAPGAKHSPSTGVPAQVAPAAPAKSAPTAKGIPTLPVGTAPPRPPARRSVLNRLASPRAGSLRVPDEPAETRLERVRELLVETLRIDAPLFGMRMLVRLRAAVSADDLIELVWDIERHLITARHSRDEMLSLQRARELLGLGNTVVADDDN